MHEYSINSRERLLVPFYMACASVLIVHLLKRAVVLPEWIPVPTAFACYAALHQLFDRYIWKWKILRKVGVVLTPDLNGTWTMATTSSVSEYKVKYEGRLRIEQTWSRISLFFEGSNATSMSQMASFVIENHSLFRLEWEYLSRKRPEFSQEDYMHYGMTRLQWTGGDSMHSLEGDYYTDRSRHQYGEVQIIKA
jgi:hypothetical protein